MPPDDPALALSVPPVPELSEEGKATSEAVDAAATDSQVDESRETTDTQTEGDASTGEASEEEIEYIQIDPKNISKDISRLLQDNPQFANVFSSHVGQKARSKHQPEIERLTEENTSLRALTNKQRFEGMEQEEINKQFANDPQFAKEYTEAVHSAPQASTGIAQLRSSIGSLMEYALSKGMPIERTEEFLQKANAGDYDKDAQGQSHSDWTGAFGLLQQDMLNELLDSKPSVEPKKAAPKPAADTANPDMSGGQRRGSETGPAKYQWTEVQNMNPIQQLEAFGDSENAIRDAIRTGVIGGISDETKVVYGVS